MGTVRHLSYRPSGRMIGTRWMPLPVRGKIDGKVFQSDCVGADDYGDVLDKIFEFPDVSFPGIVQSVFERIPGKLFGGDAQLQGFPFEKVIQQQRDIVASLPE